MERLLLTAFVMGLPEHKVRVIAPDVGGGFGSKIYLYAEDVCVTWAAKKLNRTVKWVADRSEAFLSDAHGRDPVTPAELAMDAEGHFLAFRVHTDANLGAYLSTFASAVPTILYATLLAGQYRTPHIHVEVDAWFTNTAPVDAYRGAGRPEATYLLERIVSRAGWELGIGQDEIRRRPLREPAGGQAEQRCGRAGQALEEPGQGEMAAMHQFERDRQQGLQPDAPRLSLGEGHALAVLILRPVIGHDGVDRAVL
jgi:CO/xanthine dehydrogenase Mo-binding subunit